MYDVCIVGAGPAGLSAAISASKRGVKTAVFEEHRKVGAPAARCGGLVSVRCLKTLKLSPNGGYVLNRVRRAVVHSPGGEQLTMSLGGDVLVLNRVDFENVLASRAVNMGVDLYTGVKVKKLIFSKNHVQVETVKGVYECNAVVDASGALSVFTQAVLGFKAALRKPIPAVQAEVRVKNVEEDSVYVFLGRSVAPGFFGWLIPLGSGKARVGLACEGADPTVFLKSLLRKIDASKVYSEAMWPVLTGGPFPRTFSDRFLSVGDAAGQSKPTSGGGIFTGTLCGSIAGLTLAEASRRGSYSKHVLKSYEKRWRRILGYEFRMQLLYRRIFRTLSDELLDRLVFSLKSAGLEGLKDFDYHSETVKRFILDLNARHLNLPIFQSLLKCLIQGIIKV